MDFQFNVLCFIYCVLNVLIGYVVCDCICCCSQRMFGIVVDGVFKEFVQYCIVNGFDGIVIVVVLDLYGVCMYDGIVSYVLYLFGFRCGINVVGQVVVVYVVCECKINY